MTETTLSSAQWKKRWSTLLGATLEAWAHELLYVRHVYPRETFGQTRFMGVLCHASRHPAVVSYITNTVKVAVPSVISGVADEISLTIIDHGEDGMVSSNSRELEKYILRFAHAAFSCDTTAVFSETTEHLERGMRDLVLSALALESGRATSSDSVSFKLTLHLPQEDRTCAELNEGFALGTWYAPDHVDENDISCRGRVIRPLYQFADPSVGSIQFAARKQQQDNRKPPPSSP